MHGFRNTLIEQVFALGLERSVNSHKEKRGMKYFGWAWEDMTRNHINKWAEVRTARAEAGNLVKF